MSAKRAQGDLNGFLDRGSRIQGELTFEDTFRLDGRLEGKIESSGDLVIGEGGEIEGELAVGRLFVSGTLRGTATAAERIEVTATGKVYADLVAPVLVVEEGAFLQGRCSMERASAKGGEGERPLAVPREVEG